MVQNQQGRRNIFSFNCSITVLEPMLSLFWRGSGGGTSSARLVKGRAGDHDTGVAHQGGRSVLLTQFPEYCSISSRVHPTHRAVQGAQGGHHQCSNILVFFLQLEGHPVIERTELNTNHVLLYLEKVRMGQKHRHWDFCLHRPTNLGLKTTMALIRMGLNILLSFSDYKL